MSKPEVIDLNTEAGRRAFTIVRGGMVKASDKPAKVYAKADRERLEDSFVRAWSYVAKDLPLPVRQHKFHKTRRWRFDFCWIDGMLAVEIQGGSFVNGGGRHNRPSGQANDHAKLNAAGADGWLVMQFATSRMSDPYRVAAEVAEVLRARIGT